MTRWAPLKADVLDAVATEILQQHARGRVVIGIDATDPSTAEAFAADLAEVIARRSLAVFTAALTDFRLPRGLDASPPGYDFSLLQRVLLDPFRLSVGTGFVLAGFDAARNQPVEPKWRTGPKDALLIVAGEQLHGPELRGQFNHTIWLDDGQTDPKSAYVRRSKPATSASAIIDVADPDHPRRVFADSC